MSYSLPVRNNKHSNIYSYKYLTNMHEPKTKKVYKLNQFFDAYIEEDLRAMKQNFRKVAKTLRGSRHL
ncbi:hypothetical protein EB118_14450 [bacterium]|nr:hypothetical protein [bacterium]NBX97369.1 hypothetical protein [bacterium]NDC94280.1 hypothetical protein [bacterium]NDD84393.1 hypothetical protein [bacterium]NDG31256.1 hypothetical protein [bacterium]